MKVNQPYAPTEALAASCAALDGKELEFRTCRVNPSAERLSGYYASFMADAERLVTFLAERGFRVTPERRTEMTDEQIEHMVQRFLAWKLPADFRPDGGVTFDAVGNLGTEHQYRREPSGTNLLDSRQAKEMVRYIVQGLPESPVASLS